MDELEVLRMVGFFLNALAQLVHLFAFLWSHGSNWLPQTKNGPQNVSKRPEILHAPQPSD